MTANPAADHLIPLPPQHTLVDPITRLPGMIERRDCVLEGKRMSFLQGILHLCRHCNFSRQEAQDYLELLPQIPNSQAA